MQRNDVYFSDFIYYSKISLKCKNLITEEQNILSEEDTISLRVICDVFCANMLIITRSASKYLTRNAELL